MTPCQAFQPGGRLEAMAMTRASGVLGDRSVLNSEPASASARVTGVFWVLTHACLESRRAAEGRVSAPERVTGRDAVARVCHCSFS